MPKYLFIAYFLGDILSEETKRELRELDISGTETLGITFGDNWLEAVSLMFPKLEVLNISHREFSSEEFAISCKNLPNLHTLRIGHYQLKNLNGISKLKNLTNLVIDKSKFSKKKDLEELFRLKNLKKFSFSENRHADWDYDFYFAKRFPKLTHLEIRWEKADDGFLEKILPKLPKLEVVVAINTKINGSSAPPSIKVFTSTKATTIMESIAYFRINGDQKQIRDAIMRFWEIYHYVEGRRLSEPEELAVCVDKMEMLFESFKFDQEMSESTIHCLDFIAGKIIEDNQEANADKILNVLLKILKYHLRIKTPPENDIFKKIFPRIERLIFVARHPNINTICALSMQIILLGKGDFIFEQMCATVLSVFLDDMDLSSELFESINFRKLYEYLKKIVKRKDQCRLRIDRTRDVIRYIELFM
ncbi:hypothetical protein CAEBREN_16319 [Caenorhabditis brenneri]|uniref:Uncharacterized protein n=1 Tax=Caenorhabditis brenneri TaxID=135651 RepID=G0PCV5_CAEBE|nr:hypothetical protein CAEBREN_16319 [Caenorhabditis brenneri]